LKSGIRKLVLAISALLLAWPTAYAATITHGKKPAVHSKHSRHARKSSWKRHGQQKIDGDRATEIQTALIREHYLDGEPSGMWDARTKEAMTRYQNDHGWQTKMLPDSRALISLGLGPKHDNLLNPESLTQPQIPTAPAPAAPANGKAGRPLQLVENKQQQQ